jgi:hypothetical protein
MCMVSSPGKQVVPGLNFALSLSPMAYLFLWLISSVEATHIKYWSAHTSLRWDPFFLALQPSTQFSPHFLPRRRLDLGDELHASGELPLLSFPFSWAATKSQAVARGVGRRARRVARPCRSSSVPPSLRSGAPLSLRSGPAGAPGTAPPLPLFPQRGQGPTFPLPLALLHRRHSSPTWMRRRGIGRRGAAALRSHGKGGEEQQREAKGEGVCSKSTSSGSIFGSRRRHGVK